ncbi:MAG TPA: hypothetical protein VK993_08895, partial [Chthoniobacterales bacterium]|nr:hypothetical protein [Chthoniobacterales bacterium]
MSDTPPPPSSNGAHGATTNSPAPSESASGAPPPPRPLNMRVVFRMGREYLGRHKALVIAYIILFLMVQTLIPLGIAQSAGRLTNDLGRPPAVEGAGAGAAAEAQGDTAAVLPPPTSSRA